MQETSLHRGILKSGASGQRGFAMAFVFVLVALLLLIAILVITGAFNANNQAQAVGVKYGVLNSAEAAANLALNRLAENPSEPVGCVTGSLNGAVYRSCLGLNNLSWPTGRLTPDYADPGTNVWVPKGAAYIYGEATNQGSRKVYVEAIAQPAPPLVMPSGAINAATDINDLSSMGINQDPLHPNDATVSANNNINVPGAASPVQGVTHAVGTDSLIGSDGTTHSGSAAVGFPNFTELAQAAQNAKLTAQAGTNLSGSTVSSGTATYTGNVYINGDVNVSSGTVTFSTGTYVYINGNLCISGTGTVVNADGGQGLMVVTGVVSSNGVGGYQTIAGQDTMLLSLASDPGAINPCGSSAADALSLSPPAATVEPVGTVYATVGSVQLTGLGTVQGALDAGTNVDLNGGPGSAVQYDAKQAQTTLTTGTMTYTAYNQN